MADKKPDKPEPIGVHDLGGLPLDGAEALIDRAEHDLAHWERRVDGIIYMLVRKGVYGDLAQLRVGIEKLGPEAYDRMTYYERWAASAARICVEKGLITKEELEQRIEELRARGATSEQAGF